MSVACMLLLCGTFVIWLDPIFLGRFVSGPTSLGRERRLFTSLHRTVDGAHRASLGGVLP